MPNTDITQTTYTDTRTKVTDYSVAPQTPDGAGEQKETEYINANFTKWFGYYKKIPELKKAIDAFATWVLGKGYIVPAFYFERILDKITGWGEDTFQSILWNMLVIKKIHGDAYAEIIRDNKSGELVNLKPLNPAKMKTICNKQGRVIRYEQYDPISKKSTKTFDPPEIFHIVNDRVADEIHGTGTIEACEWVILARNEAMADWRRILHRSTIRIIEVDEDDRSRMANLKKDYAEAIDKGEVLLVPKGTGQIQDFAPPNTAHLETIRYYENFFYQALGVPKVILGGSEEFTEASSKISYLTYEQIYTREVVDLEADIWNQLGIRITFNKPASIKNEMLSSEEKNTGQVGFQPKDTTATLTRE